MIKTLSQRAFGARYPQAPRASHFHNQFSFPHTAASWYLEVEGAPNYNVLYKRMGKAFQALMHAGGEAYLWFFTDANATFLRPGNDNPADVPALAYFHALGITGTFKGALQVPLEELPVFIAHLMGLSRTNGVMGYVWFINEAQTLLGSFCQYGNLHFSALEPSAAKQLPAAFAAVGLVVADQCRAPFSSRLKDRRTVTS